MNKQVVFLKISAWPRCMLVVRSLWCRARRLWGGRWFQMHRIGCALSQSPTLAPGEAALVPMGLSDTALGWAWHPQPDVPGGSGCICWELPPGMGGGGVQLPLCCNDKIKLAMLFLKLSQLKRQRQSVLFSLHWQNQDAIARTQLPIGQ